MIKASRNQKYNVGNLAQGQTKKVLTVCSAGLLRSATLANFLVKEYGYNVRNCGTVDAYALIPISEALVLWADEIVFVNRENFKHVESDLNLVLNGDLSKVKVLNIEDSYDFNSPKLIEICRKQYEDSKPVHLK